MAIRVNGKPKASVEQAKEILQSYSDKAGMFIDLDRVIDYEIYVHKQKEILVPQFQEIIQDKEITHTKPTAILMKALELFDVDTSLLLDKQRDIKLTKEVRERVLEDPNMDPDFIHFIKIYHDLSDLESLASQTKFYKEEAPMSARLTHDGHRMVQVKPQWDIASTGRIQSNSPNLQGIRKSLKEIITYPAGYQLVQADSGQIEPRIMYSKYLKDPLLKRLIEVYDDAYWGQLHFIMMTPDEEREARAQLHLVAKKEWDPSLRDTLKKLGLAGSYGSTNLERFDRNLASGYMAKIVNHPARAEWEREVRRQVFEEGVDTFYSAFGNPITPQVKEGKYNDPQAWRNHLVRCGINNPLQRTAADLMAESVYHADMILRNETKKFASIAAYIHDAGYFYVHEDDIHIADKLGQCMAYDVDDWIPIRAETEVGPIRKSDVPTY